MSVSLIYFGTLYQIAMFIYNSLIFIKICQNTVLYSPILAVFSRITGNLYKKCSDLDKSIKENICNC